MRSRMVVAAIAAALAVALIVPLGASAATAPTTHGTSFTNVPVTGTAANKKSFTGTFTVDRFVSRGGKAYAVGTLKGKIGKRAVKTSNVAFPVTVDRSQAGAAATCGILHLDLGPLDLNLLGLKVHLNEVVLDITAQSGPGNLLGNLLCSVAHLLDTPALPVGQLTGLLNMLLQLVNTPALTNL